MQWMLLRANAFLGREWLDVTNFENWRRVSEKDGWGLYLFDHQFYFSPSSLKQILHDAGYNGFCLLGCNRTRPSINPKRVFRQPLKVLLSWIEWTPAKAKWPKNGAINVMIVVGRREPGLTCASSGRAKGARC
jgi:hypothetical protein